LTGKKSFTPYFYFELGLRGSCWFILRLSLSCASCPVGSGEQGIADLLVVVLLLLLAQDAMATDDSSITGGLVQTTIIGWSYSLTG